MNSKPKNKSNCIIYVILKVREPNCIFPKTSGMPPMLGLFFISIPIHLILAPPLTKKLEAIGLKLGSNNRTKINF
jgi:hypothetical protein